MAIKKKIEMQGDVFEGISSVFIVKGGITTAEGTGEDADMQIATILEKDVMEFPVSDDSGFTFDTGQPSVEHFKVKGLNSSWVSTFTPGDGSMTLEIPCNETNIIEYCFGGTKDMKFTIPEGIAGTSVTATGKGFGPAQTALTLGMLVLNDTADKILYVKKAKFMAQILFDGSNKPLCVVLTGSISTAESDAFGILTPVTP